MTAFLVTFEDDMDAVTVAAAGDLTPIGDATFDYTHDGYHFHWWVDRTERRARCRSERVKP